MNGDRDMPTNYERGRAAEYAARDKLLADGWHTVLRTAGSHGAVDLVAVGDHAVLFVQVKHMAEPRSYEMEHQALTEWKVPPGCMKELWLHDVGAKRWIVLPA